MPVRPSNFCMLDDNEDDGGAGSIVIFMQVAHPLLDIKAHDLTFCLTSWPSGLFGFVGYQIITCSSIS